MRFDGSGEVSIYSEREGRKGSRAAMIGTSLRAAKRQGEVSIVDMGMPNEYSILVSLLYL